LTSVAFGVFTLALLIPSVVLHELAHGYVSLRHGDPTARDAGRLSLNPLRHVDPFGTVLLLIAPLWGVPALFRIDPLFNLLVPR
jgi:Zn-dependent protease